ncbi:hypothetical protein CC86DRAFT_332334 [Ophiobolus disseminans]|uniref:Cupin type-2 domain-containing protein n=1 Tax=Ophiobolus disseminans TaxID=1469910 RepID=A0A6A6ZKW7_9PLEO|nr:hypothetical protein CC86DRAFT_332334 [Ophiobolus disseminans]
MYSTTHYHSTSHEVLCVFRGRARLLFGGEQNPERVEIECGAGDAIVIPAGVAHRLVRDVDGKFEMVGAYPRGRGWDMCYGVEGEEKKAEKVKEVEWFKKDPLYGDDGLRCGVGRGWKERVVGKEVANCKVVDWKERATQLTERSALALSKINPPPTFS